MINFCFYLPEGTEMGDPTKPVCLSVVTANEPGHAPTQYEFQREHAQEICDQMNRQLGLTKEQVDAIVASSMFGVPYPNTLQSV